MARFDFLKWRRGSAAAAGRLGEAAAERFLWWRGYRIIDRNYSNDQGEIDLIAERNGVCVFVEVKSRTINPEGRVERDPLDAVDARKRRNLRAAARVYINGFLPARFPHRFDFIAVDLENGRGRVRKHEPNALDPLPDEFVALHSAEAAGLQEKLQEALR
jgi:putative endonuclease